MTTQTEALKLALEALKNGIAKPEEYSKAITAVKEALAQPEQEPEFVTHNVDKPYDWSEWVCPNPSGYLMKCCDCGLVHEAEFGVVRYKSETEREDCDMVDDPNLQAVFRMRRSEKWSPEDTAHRAGGLPMVQPEQEQNLKLMPREATPEMLKAMDECSTEGYDERLYEGHAGSVYMAAWDAFHGQHCYCGDITNLGVIHRDDGPCHYPEHKEPKQEQEPVAWIHNFIEGGVSIGKRPIDLDRHPDRWTALYKDPKPCPTCEALARSVMLDQTSHDTTPPQRTWVGLTDDEIMDMYNEPRSDAEMIAFGREVEAKLKEKNT